MINRASSSNTDDFNRIKMLLDLERSSNRRLQQRLEKAEHDRDRYKKRIESLSKELRTGEIMKSLFNRYQNWNDFNNNDDWARDYEYRHFEQEEAYRQEISREVDRDYFGDDIYD